MSRSEGVWGEALVADFLREKGYKLAAHSYHCRFGEIDLIAWDKDVLCFVEVKTRTNTQMGLPREYVSRQAGPYPKNRDLLPLRQRPGLPRPLRCGRGLCRRARG